MNFHLNSRFAKAVECWGANLQTKNIFEDAVNLPNEVNT